MVVFTRARDGPYAELAAEIASARDEPVVSTLTRLPEADRVLFVDSPASIQPDDLRAALTRFVDAAPYTQNVGVITGRTPTEARDLYFRRARGDRREPERKHCIAVPDATSSIGTNDETATLLTAESVTRSNLAALDEEGLDSLSAVLHGSNMFARLSDGVLSGYPLDPERFDFDGQQPPFVDTESNTERVETALRSESLEIPQVFLDGCSALVQNTLHEKDDPTHVGLGLLANAECLIGTYRITECIEHHGPLHHNLLRAGYSAAERAYVLNRSAETAGFDPYPYVIAGVPDHEPARENTRPMEYDVTIDPGENRCFVRTTDVDTPIIDVRVPADAFDPAAETLYVRCVEGPKRPLYYTAFREGDEVRVVINAWGLIVADRFEFEISPHGTPNEDRSRLRALSPERLEDADVARMAALTDAVARAEDRQWAGLPAEQTRRKLKECRSSLRRANERTAEERYAVQAYRETLTSLVEASDHLARAQEQLRETVRDRDADSIQDRYLPRTDAAAPRVDTTCPYCGGNAYERRRQDQFGRVRRALAICANCAYLYDVPVEDGDERVYPKLRGDFHRVDGPSSTYTVEFENPRRRPVQAHLYLSIEELDERDVVDRPSRDVVLEPGETVSTEFEVDVEALEEHLRSEWRKEATIEVHPDYSEFGPRYSDVGPQRVEEALEAAGNATPDALEADEVVVELEGQELSVPREIFDVERGEQSYTLAVLAGHFVLEALVVLDDLSTYSGTRTLYPDLS